MNTGLASIVIYEGEEKVLKDFAEKWLEGGYRDSSMAEEGCMRYDLAIPVDEPNQLHLTEYWRDKESLELHKTLPHFASLMALRTSMGVEKAPKTMAGKQVMVVTYRLTPENRVKFVEKWKENEFKKYSLMDEGCTRFDLSVPVFCDDQLMLTEYWDSDECREKHYQTEKYKALQQLKTELDVKTSAEIFQF